MLRTVAPGNVADHVVIERQSESTIMLADGARDAYLGYVTLKVSIRPGLSPVVVRNFSYISPGYNRRLVKWGRITTQVEGPHLPQE